VQCGPVSLFLLTGDERPTAKDSGVIRRRDPPSPVNPLVPVRGPPPAVGLRPTSFQTFRPTVYPTSSQIRYLSFTAGFPKEESRWLETRPERPGFLRHNGRDCSPKIPELRSHYWEYCEDRCGAVAGIHDSLSGNPDSRLRTRCNNPRRARNIHRVFYRE